MRFSVIEHLEIGFPLTLTLRMKASHAIAANMDEQMVLDACLKLLIPGGQLLIAFPYSWLENFIPKENWIGGTDKSTSQNALKNFFLMNDYTVEKECEISFIIREHSRKFQLSVAHGIRLIAPL